MGSMAENALTDVNRQIIDRARAFSEAHTTDALRAFTGTPASDDADAVRVNAISAAQYLIRELVAIIDRLTEESGKP